MDSNRDSKGRFGVGNKFACGKRPFKARKPKNIYLELGDMLLSGCSEEEIKNCFDNLNSEAHALTVLTILQKACEYELALERLEYMKELNIKKTFPETITIGYPTDFD